MHPFRQWKARCDFIRPAELVDGLAVRAKAVVDVLVRGGWRKIVGGNASAVQNVIVTGERFKLDIHHFPIEQEGGRMPGPSGFVPALGSYKVGEVAVGVPEADVIELLRLGDIDIQ